MNDRLQHTADLAIQLGINVGSRILGALVLWTIGRMLIRGLVSLIDRATALREVDATVARYLHSASGLVLNLLLLVAVLGVFGVETTTFAGILTAMGVAIGLAWSGLLSNLAAGVFMLVLRPFQVGDVVTAGGVTGKVYGIGLFATTIDASGGARTFIGNAKIFSDTIQNYSAGPIRRVDCVAPLAHGADQDRAIETLRARVKSIPNVASDPEPCVEILEVTAEKSTLTVRSFTDNDHYWEVYFATTRAIRQELATLGFPRSTT